MVAEYFVVITQEMGPHSRAIQTVVFKTAPRHHHLGLDRHAESWFQNKSTESDLHFHKISRWFVYTLKFEKHYSVLMLHETGFQHELYLDWFHFSLFKLQTAWWYCPPLCLSEAIHLLFLICFYFPLHLRGDISNVTWEENVISFGAECWNKNIYRIRDAAVPCVLGVADRKSVV